jgi:hypothetical protein
MQYKIPLTSMAGRGAGPTDQVEVTLRDRTCETKYQVPPSEKGGREDFPTSTKCYEHPAIPPENGVEKTRFCVAGLWGYIIRPLKADYLVVPTTVKKRNSLLLDIYRREIYHRLKRGHYGRPVGSSRLPHAQIHDRL